MVQVAAAIVADGGAYVVWKCVKMTEELLEQLQFAEKYSLDNLMRASLVRVEGT